MLYSNMAVSQSAAGSLSASEPMKSEVFERDTEPDAAPEGILTTKTTISTAIYSSNVPRGQIPDVTDLHPKTRPSKIVFEPAFFCNCPAFYKPN